MYQKDVTKCEECGKPTYCDMPLCEACCEHDDIDYPVCCSCGKDMTEEFACRAEAWADAMEDR